MKKRWMSALTLTLALVEGCSLSRTPPAEDPPRAGADSQRSQDTAKRRISVDISNATFESAASKVCAALDLQHVLIRDEHPDLGVGSVTLKCQGASLWEAMDLLSEAAGERFDVAFPTPSEYPEQVYFKFLRPFLRWDTIGDVRVFSATDVFAVFQEGQSQVHLRFYAAFAPWAVPKRARIEDIRIAGHPTQQEVRILEFGARKGDLPRKEGCITAVDVWCGRDYVPLKSLNGAKTVTVEGKLVITLAAPNGDKEIGVPFDIRNVPVHSERDR